MVTGRLAGAIGQAFPTPPGTFASAEAIAAHAALGCASATISGGDCGSGALAGGFTKITSPYIAEFAGATSFSEKFIGAVLAGALGGTVSELTGGKFSNGAITGALAYLFNQAMDGYARQQALRQRPCNSPTMICQSHNAFYQSAVDERARQEAIEPIAPELNLISAGGLATFKSISHGGLIAGGHAFKKHVLMQGELRGLGIRTREQFATHIDSVINNPTAFRSLSAGRSAYWHANSGTSLDYSVLHLTRF